jgi:hypothetical protein
VCQAPINAAEGRSARQQKAQQQRGAEWCQNVSKVSQPWGPACLDAGVGPDLSFVRVEAAIGAGQDTAQRGLRLPCRHTKVELI